MLSDKHEAVKRNTDFCGNSSIKCETLEKDKKKTLKALSPKISGIKQTKLDFVCCLVYLIWDDGALYL